MSLTAGTQLGVYQVTASLGAGGMGEVYRARDTRLDRAVAIKVLPDTLARDPERLARLEREGRLLGALNHPNIATIHGLEDAGGTRFLVLELVEGETLAERIAQGALPVEDALPIAIQMAEALDAAHEKGVIHRDLKPANVKVTPDGRVKVLDFGLAKALDGEPTSATAGLSQSPTLSMQATQAGVILGTAAYMSPEQAKGRASDRQTDIWAFGCVLYELLAGRPAFDGEDVSEILASVIKGRVEIDRLPAATPPRLREVLTRCLSKDLKRRFRDIGDVRYELDAILAGPAEASDAPVVDTARPARAVPRWAWGAAVAAAAVVAALGGTGGVLLTRPGPQPVVRLTVVHPGDAVVHHELDTELAFSPDGRRLAYLTRDPETALNATSGTLYVRDLDQLVPRRLAEAARTPFFSPDGQWIGFMDDRDRTFYRVPVTGGPPIRIGRSPLQNPRGASWAPDGRIVFAMAPGAGDFRSMGLWSIPVAGGESSRLTTADAERGEAAHLFPEILPGGRAVLFTILGQTPSTEDSRIAVVNLDTGTHEVLVQGGSHPRYAASGHIVYAAAGSLRAVAFDADRLAVRGTPVPVQEGIATKATGAASFALAPDGTLAYVAGAAVDITVLSRVGGFAGTQPMWVDREGRADRALDERLLSEPRGYLFPRVSPDGERMALMIDGALWMYEAGRGVLRRLTPEARVTSPLWSPDGARVAYHAASADGGEGIFWRAADGSGGEERLTTGNHRPSSWSADGRRLLYGDVATRGIGIVDLDDRSSSPRALVAPRGADQANGVVSPDGRWLAYQSNETGQYEVYVRGFADGDGPQWLLSGGGGVQPVWAPDGAALYYRSGGSMMAVAVGPGLPSAWGRSVRLFESPDLARLPDVARHFDIAPDGRRFLVLGFAALEVAGGSREIVIVQHWLDELKRLVP